MYYAEIFDDMYVITREIAESYKKVKEKPPVLASLVVSPTGVQMQPGKKQAFVARGVDQYGGDIAAGEVEWQATGGSIDKDGVLTAGKDDGGFILTATASPVIGSVTVTVAKPGSAVQPPTPGPVAPGVLRWTGEIPPQKWMNFYTKVLSRFAAGKGLKSTLSVEVSLEGGISPQRIEETKVALQELGLKSDIETQ